MSSHPTEKFDGHSSDEEDDWQPSAAHVDEDDVPQTKDEPEGDDEEEGDEAQAGEDDEEGGEDLNEDEDEEDEEDEEEDDIQGPKRKRRKRDARMQFIDVEAEVDEDEDEEFDEDEGGEMPEEVHPDDLAVDRDEARDHRRHQELDRKRALEANMDAEKQAAALKERYGRRGAAAVDSTVVDQRLLLPSVNDPHIWGVRCKAGKETEVIFSIMKRQQQQKNTREPLEIFSVFERGAGTMQGYIYVEARTQAAVFKATEGVTFCYARSNVVLIPVSEMPDLLRVTKSKTISPGDYVRMRRPALYAGDLAQVVALEANGLDVTVRLIPRIDYGSNDDPNAPADSKKRNRFGGAKAGPRPPQRPFNEVEARKGKNAKHFTINGGLGRRDFTYKGDSYEGGFLIKDYKINWLQTENVDPKLDEVTKFTTGAADGTEEIDLGALATTLKNTVATDAFLPGDVVEVSQGEQQGVFGKAISVRGEIVTIEITAGDMKGQRVEAPVKTLRKRFREGDHVKVISGRYRDEVGLVIKISGDQVTFLSDTNNQELPVLSRDLRLASATTAIPSVGAYDLYDLVQLDAATVACVVRVDRESLKVLDQNGSVRTLLPSQISNKLDKRRNAVATDRDGSELRHEDTIKEQGLDARSGRIIHIHRNFLFCQNRQQTENGGIFVARSSSVTTVAAKGGRLQNSGPDLTKMNVDRMRQPNGAGRGGAMLPPKSMGRDRMIGKTVTIRTGNYKGLLGIVKDTNDTEARVELHTKSKIIAIAKDKLMVKDPITGQAMDFSKFGSGRGRPMAPGAGGYGGRTPGATPSWGRTPGGGSATPAWKSGGSGGKTPAWSSAKTPAWSGNDGSRTAYGGNDGSRTAYGGNDGSRTAYGGSTWSASAKTPNPYASNNSSWGAAPRSTTAASPASNNAYQGAPTPAPYDAPTPGYGAPTPADQPTPRYGGAASYGAYATPNAAPTPGAYAAPTPGAYTADTPRDYGETPGGWAAPTPAAGGDDDPSYE